MAGDRTRQQFRFPVVGEHGLDVVVVEMPWPLSLDEIDDVLAYLELTRKALVGPDAPATPEQEEK